MKSLVSFVGIIGLASISFAQNLVGNGGDVVAGEFNSIARTAVYFLQKRNLKSGDLELVSDIQKKIETTVVESVVDELVIDGRVVDAINYPSVSAIKINRKRWEQVRLRSPSERTLIVLHEYIWIAGVDDSHYAISTRLTNEIVNDLDKNSVSTERYQLSLADFYSELVLFRVDILGMQGTGVTDFPSYCYAAGALKVHADKVNQLTKENGFWFSTTQKPEVDSRISFIQTFAQAQVNNCKSGTAINFGTQMQDILKMAEAIRYLMMITQFSESEL
tara:strand:- start:4505 stop:5332 length:828 start_codon:yes stop_codon:yes gene_type:complete